ncbi:capsular polysaccharide export protein, LipB/KpsS family [Fodinibius sediminis]|uniref:Capsule polysaccharide biosynthesis protein n=1 Tax=Fodinibius sediminis TaxID=1214077 RepID=A0A521EUX1_9BACT|nr:hypothetical protein [Fodinibius sediminis]SMO87748.1 Capsule polysaccharide biosynthesis protein [Fodinibius sediminis]
MKKILYAVSGLQQWIDLAIKLRDELNWEPIYWLTTHQIEENVKEEFPEIVHHDIYDANKDRYHKKYKGLTFPLDRDIIEDFLSYEKNALKMMDRQDPYKAFTYHQRKRFYYSQLSYWLGVLGKEDIDICIFTESPHIVAHYICYAVCKYYNIDTIMFAPITLPGLIYLKLNIEDKPKYKITKGSSVRDIDNEISNIIHAYIENYRQQQKKYDEPWYMQEQRKKEAKLREKNKFIYKILKSWYKVFTRNGYQKIKKVLKNNFFSNGKVRSYIKSDKSSLENSYITKKEKRSLRKKKYEKNKKLKSLYHEMCDEFNYENSSFIYFPLHYQPERTTNPEGNYFADQQLAINLLSYYLPEDWHLVIKEHPSQFVSHMQGYLGRTSDFYTDIKKLKNVKLVNENIDSMNLISASKAVSTLTGSAGLEALIKGKPVMVFGYAWYRDLPGTFCIQSQKDCKNAIKSIKRGYKVEFQEVSKALLNIQKFFVKGYLNPSTKRSIDIHYEKHVNEMYRGIQSLIPYLNKEEKNLKKNSNTSF